MVMMMESWGVDRLKWYQERERMERNEANRRTRKVMGRMGRRKWRVLDWLIGCRSVLREVCWKS